MMLKITKQQLKAVNLHRGHFDKDAGLVFCGVAGALDIQDGLYHVEVRHRQLEPDEARPEEFSLSEQIGNKPDVQPAKQKPVNRPFRKGADPARTAQEPETKPED